MDVMNGYFYVMKLYLTDIQALKITKHTHFNIDWKFFTFGYEHLKKSCKHSKIGLCTLLLNYHLRAKTYHPQAKTYHPLNKAVQ
jgi:hypothetical protein